MKVLFLDIDGVLTSSQSLIFYKRKEDIVNKVSKNNLLEKVLNKNFLLCPIAVSNLNFILDKIPDVKVVISSSLREKNSLELIRYQLSQKGFSYPKSIISKTPSHDKEDREKEISLWCQGKDIDEIVILDDQNLSDYPTKFNNFMRVDGVTGLTLLDAIKVIKVFNKGLPVRIPRVLG